MKKTGLTAAVALGALLAWAPAQATQPSHFLFGAYPGAESVDSFETKIGHNIAIVDHYLRFSDFTPKPVADDVVAGRIPMLSWTSDDSHGAQVLARDILAGNYDMHIRLQAKTIALLGGTVFVRWQPEMTNNARNAAFFLHVPSKDWGSTYVAVWRHMYRIFAKMGATNVQWVWAPGGDAYKIARGTFPCASYFPGANFVDWMGMDTYNKSDTPQPYDVNPDFLYFYSIAPLLAPGKPLMHTQTGATNMTDAQREWVATAQSSLKSEFPLVRGFVYFNANGDNPAQGSSRQYILEGAGLDAFKTMAADPYFE